MRREWIEIATASHKIVVALSPSMRREWIEMAVCSAQKKYNTVSLHAEGVD